MKIKEIKTNKIELSCMIGALKSVIGYNRLLVKGRKNALFRYTQNEHRGESYFLDVATELGLCEKDFVPGKTSVYRLTDEGIKFLAGICECEMKYEGGLNG